MTQTVAQCTRSAQEDVEGIVQDMPEADYHAHPAIGSSLLRTILRTPADFLWASQNPAPSTPGLAIGSAVHAAYLTPMLFNSQFALQPEDWGSRNVGEGRKRWEAFKAEHAGKTVLGWDDAQVVRGCVAALQKAFPLDPAWETELSGFAKFEGGYFKGRADIDDGKTLWDVKTTTEDVDEETLSRVVGKYGYHFQAAQYLEIWAHLDQYRPAFGIVWVNKNPPHHARVTLLSGEYLDEGKDDFDYALKLHRQCTTAKHWPGYPPHAVTLTRPGWMK